MDQAKSKDQIIARSRTCPLCKSIFVYFCIKCFLMLFSKKRIIYIMFPKEFQPRNIMYIIVEKYYSSRFQNQSLKVIYFFVLYYLYLNFVYLLYVRKKISFSKLRNLSNWCSKYMKTELDLNHLENNTCLKFNVSLITQESRCTEYIEEELKIQAIDKNKNSATSLNSSLSAPPHGKPNSKTKKSSNLLSAFVRRAKRKKSLPPSIQTSTQHVTADFKSTSSIGMHTEDDKEEVELNVQSFDKKSEFGCSTNVKTVLFKEAKNDPIINMTESDSNCSLSKKGAYPMIRKFLKRQRSESAMKNDENSMEAQANTFCEGPSKTSKSCLVQNTSHDNVTFGNNVKKNFNVSSQAPTSFIHSAPPSLDISLANGLQTVQDLITNLRDKENHLIQMLTKYVKDANFQKDLLDAVSQHSKLQWETERRTNSLANDMWMHQIEIGRAQERTLQETLNSLVKQNRQLQIDNQVLFRRHERLAGKLKGLPESNIKAKDNESYIENIFKHNERLQYRLEAYTQQIEELENELHILQKQNDSLEQQARNSNSQIQNLKAIIQRTKTEYELEQVSLNCKLQNKEQIIKECVEAGDVVLEDLDGLKRQMKNLPFALNWTKFKLRGNSLTDLVHLCRSCINELSKELISSYTEITLKNKDIETLRETNSRLQENLQKSTSELNNLSKKFEENAFHEAEKTLYEQRCKNLEAELKNTYQKIDQVKHNFEEEKTSLSDAIAQYEVLTQEISEKNKMLEESKLFISNVASENIALRNQIEQLNKVLSESGAGDVAKDLLTNHEQASYLHSQYYQLLNDKQYLIDQVEALREDNRSLLDYQQSYYQHMQAQLKELETIQQQNLVMKEELESEHQTVLTLQHERMKYLEEKNVLKSIFQHLRAEISRVQKLEGTVADVSKEANRLAMVAEFNKQLGEKLKCEVKERDSTIVELRTSVEKLNNIQLQNTKEKLSLCYELSEINHIKEQLNSVLAMEVQKNVALDETKKEIENSASSQMKAYEEIQRNERAALKEVIRDFKCIVVQRDNLIKSQQKYQKEISELKENQAELLKKLEDATSQLNDKNHKIKEFTEKEEQYFSSLRKLEQSMSYDVLKYEGNLRQLEKLIEQLRKEKDELENSVKYLQNNIQKLYSDLNQSRQNEKETKDMLSKFQSEKAALELDLNQFKSDSHMLNADKQKLVEEIEYLNGLFEKLLTDFEHHIKSASEKEELFKTEMDESKALLVNSAHEICRINKILKLREMEIDRIKEECDILRLNDKEQSELIRNLNDKNIFLLSIKEEKVKLEADFHTLQIEHSTCHLQFENSKKELDRLRNQLKILAEQKEEDYVFYKGHVDDLFRENELNKSELKKQISQLNAQVKDLTQKLANERSAYTTLSQIHKDVSNKFLNSIKQLVDEKNARQEVAGKLKESDSQLSVLTIEKQDLQKQISDLSQQLNNEQCRVNVLTRDKENVEKSFNHLQEEHNKLLARCKALENELRGTNQKLQDLSEREEPSRENSSQELQLSKERAERLKKDLDEGHQIIIRLREETAKLQQQITALEFQKCEITLRLHEMQGHLDTERGLCEQFKNTNKLILAAILQMKDEGKVEPCDCNHLLYMIRSVTDSETEINSNSNLKAITN